MYFAYSTTMSENVFAAYFHVGNLLKHQENAYLGLGTSYLRQQRINEPPHKHILDFCISKEG